MLNERYVDALSSKYPCVRKAAIKKIKKSEKKDRTLIPNSKRESVNCQIHTSYSFSPYTPSLAAYMAYKYGLNVAGIMDNYTLKGAKEFIEACRVLGLTYTVAAEVRAEFNFKDMPYSNAAIMGVAAKYIDKLNAELKPLRVNQRHNVEASLKTVNTKIADFGIKIDFYKDILPLIPFKKDRVLLSKYIYYALATKLVDKFGKGDNITAFLTEQLNMELSENDVALLSNHAGKYYIYDLANIISDNYRVFKTVKSYATPEKVVSLAHSVGAICAFEYVIKKKDNDENSTNELISYNKELVKKLKGLGFDALFFDPTKISQKATEALIKDLADNAMLALSLVRVEFPRRRFDCYYGSEETKKAMINSVYAVVGSEMSQNQNDGQSFVDAAKHGLKLKNFEERVSLFSRIGRKGI